MIFEPDSRPLWLLKRVAHATSTNDLAKELTAWQAVVAETQEAGRGRYGRRFVCGRGGIWLSAVVPMPGGAARWTGLALAVGWGLLQSLQILPVRGLRLRWPNDLMIGSQKLGGILLEQNAKEQCVVGVGINIFNQPADDEPALSGIVTRLADCIEGGESACPSVNDLLPRLLEGIGNGWQRMSEVGLAGMVDNLNESWGGQRAVEVRPLQELAVTGQFLGINAEGVLVLRLSDGGGRSFPAHLVERMVEL